MTDDVINFAVRLYLERSGSTPYDELSHVSGNESDEWLKQLMTIMIGGYYVSLEKTRLSHQIL